MADPATAVAADAGSEGAFEARARAESIADTSATDALPRAPIAPANRHDTSSAATAQTPDQAQATDSTDATPDTDTGTSAAASIPMPAVPDVPRAAPEALDPAQPESAPAPQPGAAPRARATPSFARPPITEGVGGGRRKWRKPAAIAALALLLVLQLVLADRAQLAASARWRPLVSTLCGALQCSVPPWREPAAFILLHRDVRPHPTLPGVLHVSATFRNDARWPQPWPALLLTLSDVDGRTVGARAFAPREYLDGAPAHGGLASGQSATVAMDIIEPAPRIVAFTFDFH